MRLAKVSSNWKTGGRAGCYKLETPFGDIFLGTWKNEGDNYGDWYYLVPWDGEVRLIPEATPVDEAMARVQKKVRDKMIEFASTL